MAKRDIPTPDVLRQLLEYDPDTGVLTWKPRPRDLFVDQRSFSTWNARFAGQEAFTAEKLGYRVGNVNYRLCMGHRVAWAIMHGRWPADEIDHINGNRSDNRRVNLREADRSQNNCNTCLRSDNTSGYRGVYFHKMVGKWEARINFQKKTVRLGFFDDPEAAHKAYVAASISLHGEFARAA